MISAAIAAEIITARSVRRLLIDPTSGRYDSACEKTVIALKRQLL
jgi:hypothetical protein